jgi:hypothetical protein
VITQKWHLDYTAETSNLFIPLTKMTCKNGTQYLRSPHGKIKSKTIGHGNITHPDVFNYQDPHVLFDTEDTDHFEVCQVISQPFTIWKLFPECIHRGIANGEDYDRVMFFISTNDKPYDIQEGFDNNTEYYEKQNVPDSTSSMSSRTN